MFWNHHPPSPMLNTLFTRTVYLLFSGIVNISPPALLSPTSLDIARFWWNWIGFIDGGIKTGDSFWSLLIILVHNLVILSFHGLHFPTKEQNISSSIWYQGCWKFFKELGKHIVGRVFLWNFHSTRLPLPLCK